MHTTPCLRAFQKSILLACAFAGCLFTAASAQGQSSSEDAPELTFAYTNDTYNGTDRYFTAGLVESYGTDRARLTLTQMGFTPSLITDAEMRHDDRPYAAVMYATAAFALPTTDPTPHWQLSGTIGFIGPMVRGEQIQESIHKLVEVKQAMGWQYQIANDFLIGAEMRYRHTFVRTNWYEATSSAYAEAGTFRTRVGADAKLSVGPRAFRLELTPRAWVPFFDATMQGGVFNRATPVAISPDRIVRLVGSVEYGVAVRFKRLTGTLTQTLLTPEFVGGMAHAWTTGGLRFRI